MKVKELIQELQKADPEAVVVMSSDEEGNNYGELVDVEPGLFYDKETHEVDVSEGEVSIVLYPNC